MFDYSLGIMAYQADRIAHLSERAMELEAENRSLKKVILDARCFLEKSEEPFYRGMEILNNVTI